MVVREHFAALESRLGPFTGEDKKAALSSNTKGLQSCHGRHDRGPYLGQLSRSYQVGKAPLFWAAAPAPPPTAYFKLLDGEPGNKEQATFFKSTSNASFDRTAIPNALSQSTSQQGNVPDSTLPQHQQNGLSVPCRSEEARAHGQHSSRLRPAQQLRAG